MSNKRTLKNWTITVEPIKKGTDGLISYVNYLQSETEHPNHKITPILQGDIIGKMKRIALKTEDFNLSRKISKGGRPANSSWSAVLSFPFLLDDMEQMKKMIYRTVYQFYEYVSQVKGLGLTEEDIRAIAGNEVIAVNHRSHRDEIHLILPQIIRGADKKLTSVNLTEKKFQHFLKVQNNINVNRYFGNSVLNYKIQAQKVYKKRIRKTAYKAIQKAEAKAEQSIDREAIEARAEAEVKAEIQQEHLKPFIDELEHIIKGLRAVGADSFAIAGLEKRLSTAKAQIENGNTQRAETTIKKAFKDIGTMKQ